ncbi:restriction endonuclease subunit S [Xanthomonas campestris pv. raphani]|uniref:restriction endonuclease subunit S n=1 Tax=Xanthomonas campestris TaxID=339 RepID=UPI0038909CB6
MSLDGEQEGTRTLVREGDILITITAELGSVAVVRGQFNKGAYINQHLALFRPDGRLCNSGFLVNFLSTVVAREQFVVSGNGGTKQGLGFDQVSGVIAAFPNLDEQLRIAQYCERIRGAYDKLRNPIDSSITELVGYRSALITAAVTGQLTELNG